MSKPERVRIGYIVLELEPGERWAVMPGEGVVLLHPDRPPVFASIQNGRLRLERVVL